MADYAEQPRPPTIFLSYARVDRERIDQLADILRNAGFQVWWDALIEGGAAFARSIESALDSADVVVVAWSQASIGSDWVRDEAAHGRDGGRFVPISLDGTPPPLGFRQYQSIDFARWKGDAAANEVQRLLAAIAALMGGKPIDRVAPPARTTAPPRFWQRRAVLAGGAALGVAALGGGLIAWRSLAAGTPDSIAVLPFANLSGDPSQSYFVDGLSEELRAQLAETGHFQVAARTSSNLFRDPHADAVATAARLGVAYLLDGSVRREGSALRIISELVEGRSGLSKWTQSYDRSVADIFAIQSEIATTVTRAVIGEVDPAAQAALRQTPGTSNVTAYEAYLKGVEQDNLDGGIATDRAAIAGYDAAIAADPQYAQAFASRSATLIDIGANHAAAATQKTYYAQAQADAARAVALAPGLAAAQLAAGRIFYEIDLDFARARPFYEKAFALGQHDADIIELFAYFSAKSGRIKPALDAIERAIMLDPLNSLMFRAKGKILLAAGRYDDAIAQLRQAIAMNPGIANTSGAIGDAQLLLGRNAQALAAYQAETGEEVRLAGIAMVQRKLGNATAADAAFKTLTTQFGDLALYQQAQVLAQWGQADAALATLEKAYATRDSGVTWLRVDPLLTPLRNKPRYAALLHDIGLA